MRMNEGMIMGLVIISFVAGIMIILGFSQMRTKDNPVGFYNVIFPHFSLISACNQKGKGIK